MPPEPARPAAPPRPTDLDAPVESELERWSRIYAPADYVYGEEPGPVARRAVRYHRGFLSEGGAALDAGCGEGQDLAFLAERGYAATGVEGTATGAGKARRLLAQRGLRAEVLQADLAAWRPERRYDLVLAVNVLQFLGDAGPGVLERLMESVAPGGVLGLSLFVREPERAPAGARPFPSLWLPAPEEVFARFGLEWPPGRASVRPAPAGGRGWQPLEAALLWQWDAAGKSPGARPFLTLVARRIPGA